MRFSDFIRLGWQPMEIAVGVVGIGVWACVYIMIPDGASQSERAVVNGAASVSALRASIPSAGDK